ncbi:HNH endonuclease [Aeromonas hydrophila]
MPTCYICDTLLSEENITEEHIILNACGGKLKSKNLICRKCNSSLGETFDAELAEQLSFFSNAFNVKRHRNPAPTITATQTSTGIKYDILPGGHPVLKSPIRNITKNDEILTLDIQAKDEKQLKQVLSGLKRTYPQINIDNFMSDATWQKRYLDSSVRVSTSIGGNGVFRSVCKAAINYYIFSGGSRVFIMHLLPYIKGIMDLECVFNYPSDIVESVLESNSASHIIHLQGCPKKKTLYCYIEYFNALNFMIVLNAGYTGKKISHTYHYDVANGKTREVKIPWLFDEVIFENDGYSLNDANIEKIKRRFCRTAAISRKIQQDRHIDNLIESGVMEILSTYPEGTILTPEIINNLSDSVVRKLMPYYIRFMRKG